MVAISDFCIDKYEAGLDDASKLGALDGTSTTAKATSKGDKPQVDITWMQAAQACANVGKRLCRPQEWMLAAQGTPDPGDTAKTNDDCNVQSNGLLFSGSRKKCKSTKGVFDLIGNAAEWVDEWHVSNAPVAVDLTAWEKQLFFTPWVGLQPDGKDGTWGVNGMAYRSSKTFIKGLPSVGARGGSHQDGDAAGRMALDIRYSAISKVPTIGFRCCRTRFQTLPVSTP
jgi:formylglycine-generating enzyme required for sulfatase activity